MRSGIHSSASAVIDGKSSFHCRGLHYSSPQAFDIPSSPPCFVGHAPNFNQKRGRARIISGISSDTMPLKAYPGRAVWTIMLIQYVLVVTHEYSIQPNLGWLEA